MRDNAVLIKIVVAAIVFTLMVVPVQAEEGSVSYVGVEFPSGNESFADTLLVFNPGSATGEADGSSAIGPPDGGKGTGPSIIGDEGDVTLGNGGSITLKFTDNYLIDVEGLDLYVFEYGPSVESFKVEISKDGSNWIDLGTISGQPTGLDINGKVAPGDKFSYVRITDANPYAPRDPKTIGQESYSGADIDAVGAIGAEERPDSDGDGVPDDEDECPDTPLGTKVDEYGCPVDVWSSVCGEFKSAEFTIEGTEPQEIRITSPADNFTIVKEDGEIVYQVIGGKSSGSLTLEPGTYILYCSGGGAMGLMSATVCIEYPVVTGSSGQPLKISDLRGTLGTDDNCNLYVADYGENQVKMINPDGSIATYASGIDRPRYQVFDSAGNLYVGSYDGNIYKVSTTGAKTVVASGIWSPQDMGFDGAGNLYVAGGYDGKIHRITPDGTKTIMDSGFAHPKHLAVYSDGNVYVVDSAGTLIIRITPEGAKASLVDLGEAISGMVTDGEYLYVSHSDKISRIDAFGQITHIATGLDNPSSLAICNGNIFVTVKGGIVKTKIKAAAKTCDWTGDWETSWGQMELLQDGNNVIGTYDHDQGRIQGTVLGRKLTGTWSEAPSYSPPGDAGDIEFILSEDCSSFNGSWRYGSSGAWAGSWTGTRISTGSGTQVGIGTKIASGTSYQNATLTHSGFDFSEGTTGEYSTFDGEVIFWQPGAVTHPDYPRDSEYLWWRNTHLDDVNRNSQTKDMGAVDITTVREVPAEWDKSPLIPPLLVGHTIVAKCYDGFVKFQVISVDPVEESALVEYSYSTDTTFDDATG